MRRQRAAAAAFALLVVGIVACTKPPTVPPVLPTTTVPAPPRPNVVRIMTDDQDVGSLHTMAKVQALLAAKGVSYTNSTATLSLCCPSRATALTGQYTHNHNIWENGGATGGYLLFKDQQQNSLAPWLKAAGYTTAHVGKYMNQYVSDQVSTVPPGWDRWFTIVDKPWEAYPYYDYTVSDNGVARSYGTADEDYATDVFANRALADLRAMESSGQPFFLDFWPTAPHYGKGRVDTTHLGPAAAPRYESANPGITAPRTANFLPAGGDDSPPMLQGMARAYIAANGGAATFPQLLDDTYRDYVNSLLSVDDSVEQLVNELAASGKLANTYIIFTSDNGLMWGNHGLGGFKWFPYEESLLVPLIVTGPGVPQGVTSNRPVSNIDIVPTILQMTGVPAGRVMDGTSLVPVPADPTVGQERAVLIESVMYDPSSMYEFNGINLARFRGVHTDGFQYTEWMDGYVELYDLQSDPEEMHNRADDPLHADNRAKLAAALAQLTNCAGAACSVSVTGLTHPSGAAPLATGRPASTAARATVPTVTLPAGGTLDISEMAPAGGTKAAR